MCTTYQYQLGYTANASAIRLGSPEPVKTTSESIPAFARAVLAETDSTAASNTTFDPFAHDPALVATVAFFLVGKMTRVIVLM